MAITKHFEYDRRILANGMLNVRRDTVFTENGVEVARTTHRYVVEPGDNVDTESVEVRRIVAIEHTPAVVQKFKEQRALKRAK